MKRFSTLIEEQNFTQGFPIRGHNGYGGEQDGSVVVLTDVLFFKSKKQADKQFPEGLPDYVKLHWATYHPFKGWEVVLGWWSNQPQHDDGNPFLQGR